MLPLLFGGDCHGLNIAIDLILTSVNAMVSGDDFVNFIVNLEKINWLIGVTEEQKDPTTAGAWVKSAHNSAHKRWFLRKNGSQQIAENRCYDG